MLDEQLLPLILGCQRQESDSQTKLYNALRKIMKTYLRSYIHCPYKAEEVMNNAFVTIFKKINLYSFKGSFIAWCKRIMYHSVCDYMRSSIKHNSLVFTEDINEGEDYQVDNLSYKKLLALIETLPVRTGAAFSLYIEGFSHRDIGKKMGISEGTSKWYVFEAREFLRNKILQNG